MSKEDVINYVMTTPGNPNKAVLSGMLDEIEGSGSVSSVSSVAVYEPHYKTFDDVEVDIKEVWVMTGVNEWSQLPIVYDADLYDNITKLIWVKGDDVEIYEKANSIVPTSIPSVSPLLPDSGVYINDAVTAYAVSYGDSDATIYIIRDDSLVKYNPQDETQDETGE